MKYRSKESKGKIFSFYSGCFPVRRVHWPHAQVPVPCLLCGGGDWQVGGTDLGLMRAFRLHGLSTNYFDQIKGDAKKKMFMVGHFYRKLSSLKGRI